MITTRNFRCGRPQFHIACFCGSASYTLPYGMCHRESGSHHVREGCSPIVREEFIRHAERHLQVWPPGAIDFLADSSPSPPPTQRKLRQPPLAGSVECVTQSRHEVKAWARSNARVLLRSGTGFDKAVMSLYSRRCWRRAVAVLKSVLTKK